MKPKGPDSFSELRELWKMHSATWAAKGIDFPKFVHALAKYKRDSLSKWASEGDFDQLCRKGCSEVSFAIALWIVGSSDPLGAGLTCGERRSAQNGIEIRSGNLLIMRHRQSSSLKYPEAPLC